MAAEAMVRRGHAARVHQWLDGYMRRLEEFPRGTGPIRSGWQEALGDPRRVADWTSYFRREVTAQPWRQVLETWWPRLLPGVVAATHGVIRVGHAVRALTDDGEDGDHLTELAMAWPTGRPGGSRYPVPPVPGHPREPSAPPPGSWPMPGPGLRMRWLRSRGSPTSRAASVIASPSRPGCRAGRPHWPRHSSRPQPRHSGPGWPA
jgi:hypothetical protein